MTDRDVSGHCGQRLLVEHLADQPEILEHQHLRSVRDGDTGRFLSAVLQCVEAVVGEFRDFFAGSPDAEDAALLAGRVFQLAGHGMGAPWRVGVWLEFTVHWVNPGNPAICVTQIPNQTS